VIGPAVIGAGSVLAAAVRVVGLALLAGVTTTIAAFVYRVRVRTGLPEGATLILGLGVVAIALNTRVVFVQYVGGTGDPLSVREALVNVTVFVAAGMASYGGHRAGEALAVSDRFSLGWLRPDIGPIVRATGRVITVTLPGEIADLEGYDPVPEKTKTALEGRRLEFPRGLTVAELESELAGRLTAEYDVGHVDLELAADGTVEHLGVGKRPAGIGATLPPGTAAVAVRADPPFSASPGDTLQVWRAEDGEPKRLGTAELRASVGDVATIVADEAVAERVDPTAEYRLMTLSAESRPEREFAMLLRQSEKTTSVIAVGSESPLPGTPIGALAVTVLAVRSADGEVEPIPEDSRAIGVGEELIVVGRSDVLRRLEAASGVEPVEAPGVAAAANAWEPDDTPDRPEGKHD